MTRTTTRWIAARTAVLVVATCITMYVANEAVAFGHMVTHIRHSHSHSAQHVPGQGRQPSTQVVVARPDDQDCPASLGTLRTGGDVRHPGSDDACAAPRAVAPGGRTPVVAAGSLP
ncbi:hypothetical protein PSU4_10380 [Pseudonocardia sulfidoxydans NBRC 16205]|uniref:Uncharacterized protein n=2 Tax=Pseudonocardia sulfidoxydans TaxID=54011 RepID=A0A511DEE1_9PSEU|nr:hypothetical protein [Pseudonocardia sulfidoxydans]GEL22084.1 hypothetical protein PSU4_10380 [Pseudonocardia sulfidoxydans NBRC 16205]